MRYRPGSLRGMVDNRGVATDSQQHSCPASDIRFWLGYCAQCDHDDNWYADEYGDIYCHCDIWLRQGHANADGTITDYR